MRTLQRNNAGPDVPIAQQPGDELAADGIEQSSGPPAGGGRFRCQHGARTLLGGTESGTVGARIGARNQIAGGIAGQTTGFGGHRLGAVECEGVCPATIVESAGAPRNGKQLNAGFPHRYRPGMKVRKLLHTRYRLNDLDKSVHFYKDVLGLEEVRRHKSPRGSELVFLKTPGSEELIELCSFPGSGPVQVQADLTHLAFEVDSL